MKGNTPAGVPARLPETGRGCWSSLRLYLLPAETSAGNEWSETPAGAPHGYRAARVRRRVRALSPDRVKEAATVRPSRSPGCVPVLRLKQRASRADDAR